MVCLVQARETIQIPPESQICIPVTIPKIECLGRYGVLEPNVHLFETCEIHLTPGIIDTQAPEKNIYVLNCGDQNVTIYPNMKLGTCESLYEQEPIKHEMCAKIIVSQKTDKPLVIPEHLQDLSLRSSTKLTESEKHKFTELLIQYQDAFSKSATYSVFTDLVQHKINTGTALPIRQHIRRLPFGKREIGNKGANKMLTMGVIEPSSSLWSSPVVLVKKKESTRFCVDYLKLNDVTAKDAYPFPLISDYLDALTGSKCFSSMDLNSGFWQVSIDPLNKEKTAFSTSIGLY